MTVATAQSVQYLNLAYFGRPADPASLSAFPASGMSDEEIVLQFVKTGEYTTNTVNPNSAANSAGGRDFNVTNLINTFYQRLFGRDAANSEVTGWSNALSTGAVNYDYLGITIMRAGLNLPAGTEMRSVLEAKMASAQSFSDSLAADSTAALAYSTDAAIQVGISYLSGVTTTTPATAAALSSSLSSLTGTTNPGQSFSLTIGVDSVTGGAGDDTITAGTVATTDSNGAVVNNVTLSATDTIDGGAGSDTLNVTEVAAITVPSVTVSNVETVNLTSAAGVTANLTSGFTGVNDLNVTAVGATNIDALSTIDVALTATTASATTAIDAAKDVTVTNTGVTDTAATIAVGSATAVSGAVSVTQTTALLMVLQILHLPSL